jgi:hypothetical protein
VFVAEIAQALEALVGERADAAFALHGFDHDRAHVRLGGRGAERVVVAEGQLPEAGQERAEALGQLFRPAAEIAAMERPWNDPSKVRIVVRSGASLS